jgi:hypothetical protein
MSKEFKSGMSKQIPNPIIVSFPFFSLVSFPHVIQFWYWHHNVALQCTYIGYNMLVVVQVFENLKNNISSKLKLK